jgi:hypothetical protein
MSIDDLREEIAWLKWCLKYLPAAEFGTVEKVRRCRKAIADAQELLRLRLLTSDPKQRKKNQSPTSEARSDEGAEVIAQDGVGMNSVGISDLEGGIIPRRVITASGADLG